MDPTITNTTQPSSTLPQQQSLSESLATTVLSLIPVSQIVQHFILALPHVLCLLMAGSASFVYFIDPYVRQSLLDTRNKLKHWRAMYERTKAFMGPGSILACVIAMWNFYYSGCEVHEWWIGSLVLLSAGVYTGVRMNSTRRVLETIDDRVKEEEGLKRQKEERALGMMRRWVRLHVGRLVLALAAAGVFYVAEVKEMRRE